MRRFVLGAVVLLALLLGSLLWIALGTRSPRASRTAPIDTFKVDNAAPLAPLPRPSVVAQAKRPDPAPHADGTVIDRERREEVRSQLLAAHPPAPEPPNTASAAPEDPDLAFEIPGHLDPEYIKDRVHEDYFPLAEECYKDALGRTPDLRGKLVMKFHIAGDKNIGGIVEDADFGDDSDIKDPEFRTCMRESLLSMAFKAPEEGGKVEVHYPIMFSPDDDDSEDSGAPDAR